jgi:DNA repair protein RadC
MRVEPPVHLPSAARKLLEGGPLAPSSAPAPECLHGQRGAAGARGAEGPGERLEGRGADALSDLELLGVLLGEGRRPDAAERRAYDLLARFGDLRGLASAGAGRLTAWEGLPRRQARRLVAAFALGRRAAAVPLRRGRVLKDAADILAAYGPVLRDVPREVVLAVHLDAKGRVLREVRVSEGSLMQSCAHPREVFGPALRESAAALILVHNHPSGDPEPSTLDIDVTRRLVAAGALLGISLLDHLVLGDACYVSLLERGVIPREP